MSKRKIIVSFVYPPIPIRQFDFQAVYDDYEPGCPIGHVHTAQQAVDDLKAQL